jgi:hypothetical protein
MALKRPPLMPPLSSRSRSQLTDRIRCSPSFFLEALHLAKILSRAFITKAMSGQQGPRWSLGRVDGS